MRGADKWRQWNYTNIQNTLGEIGTSPSDNADNFAAFYNTLYDNDGVEGGKADEWYEKMPDTPTDREWREPQAFELVRAIRELKTTAPGLSGVPAVMWKAFLEDETLKGVMLDIMRECWNTETVPKDWLKYYMTVLEKKGDLTLPDNYRGISIADSFSKVYTTILKHRLQDLYEDLAPQNSNGFRKGRGRTDAIFSLMEVLRRRKQWGLNSWVILFDLYKAFDVIPRAYIWKSMAKMGVTFKMIQVVKSTLEDATCYLHVEQEVREVKMKNGSGQGTSLGPALFQFFFLPLVNYWLSKWAHLSTSTFHYHPSAPHTSNADSSTLIETRTLAEIFADDMAALMKRLQDAEEIAEDFVNFLADFKCTVHVGTKENAKSKSVVLFVPANEEERARHSGKPLSLSGGRTIPCVESAVYLGQTITSTLSDTPHLRIRASKAAQVFGALGRNLMRANHVWTKVKKMVFESMILPTLLDGIECCVVTQQALDELTTVYHRMVRASSHVSPYTQRKWKLTSETLLERLDLHPLHHYVDMKILGYAGHVERMEPDRRPKRLRDGVLDGPKMSGGQYKTHHQTVEECANRKGLTDWKKLAARKSEWRKSIRTSVLLRARTSVKPQLKFVDRWAEAHT